jgi:hypothetical protein
VGKLAPRNDTPSTSSVTMYAILGADVEHRDNVGMIQRGDVARLLLESRETGWIRREIRRQDL